MREHAIDLFHGGNLDGRDLKAVRQLVHEMRQALGLLSFRHLLTVRQGPADSREPGSPWENGYCESFNGKLRAELLNGEIFCSLKEAKVLIEQWRRHYKRASQHPSVYVVEEKRFC
jgi:hypothetical protein